MVGHNFHLDMQTNEILNTKDIKAEFRIETDFDAIKKFNLGNKPHTCKICGSSGDFQSWCGREMYIGSRDEFEYFVCPECECLQIDAFPENIGKYYPSDYYSYRRPEINPPQSWTKRDKRMVLDVGCGAGDWLCSLTALGYVNLFGCDPYIERDIKYSNGVKIKKCTVHEMEGQYDVINCSHAFEHMSDPFNVFKSFERLLKHETDAESGESPKLYIRVPIFPNTAFDIFGPCWYQMDPPRHFFLHSVKSIKILAESVGLKIDKIEYEGHESQFSVSRMCLLDIPFYNSGIYKDDMKYINVKNDIPLYEALSTCAIAAGTSDQAFFTLVRKE
jgi:SAM-dependent methyltransferase